MQIKPEFQNTWITEHPLLVVSHVLELLVSIKLNHLLFSLCKIIVHIQFSKGKEKCQT